MATKEILTIEELAKTLRVNVRSIYRNVQEKKIPHMRIGKHGGIRFKRDEVMKALSIGVK